MANDRIETRKEQILSAAIKVFARKGFQDSTIADIVKEAKISDATLYEYFSSKEELLFSIPGELTRKRKEEIEFILNHIKGAPAKIHSIIYHYLWFWQNNPDYASIAMLILRPNRKFIDTEAYKVIFDTFQIVLPVVEDGIKAGEFKAETNPKLVLTMLLGTIEHLVINKLLHGRPENLLDFADPVADQLLGGIINHDDEKKININIALDSDRKLIDVDVEK